MSTGSLKVASSLYCDLLVLEYLGVTRGEALKKRAMTVETIDKIHGSHSMWTIPTCVWTSFKKWISSSGVFRFTDLHLYKIHITSCWLTCGRAWQLKGFLIKICHGECLRKVSDSAPPGNSLSIWRTCCSQINRHDTSLQLNKGFVSGSREDQAARRI